MKFKKDVIPTDIKIPKFTFDKVGDFCTIRMGKARYTFKRIVDTNINIDAWRLYDGTLINPVDNSIVGIMWSLSDAEGVIQIKGEEDFVGGYHGDEIYTSINILVDGLLLDISRDYSNLEFSNIIINSESKVYHCNTSAKEGVQAFNRFKTLIFEDNTVKISNRYVCLEDLLIYRAALGLFQCNKTYNGTKFFTHYNNNNDLKLYTVPNYDEYAIPLSSSKLTEVHLYTSIGVIEFKINKGHDNPHYLGFVNNFKDQNRLKIYLDYIKADNNGTQVLSGDILQAEFQFTIK